MGIFNKTKKSETSKKEDLKKEKSTTAKSSMKDLYKDEKKKENKSSASDSKKQTKKFSGFAYRTLVKPLITEKAANLSSEGKYAFEVEGKANKIEIANAINEVYGIKPTSVNIVNVNGKKVRQGRTLGKRKDWKKAIVTLPKGNTINIYEGV
jgi:large subunit ribosomal protein L23